MIVLHSCGGLGRLPATDGNAALLTADFTHVYVSVAGMLALEKTVLGKKPCLAICRVPENVI